MKLLVTILLTTILSVYPQQLYEHQIIPFDGEADDSFGRDVAICDSFIFIGSRGDDNYSGSVYVYKKENNDWVFLKNFLHQIKENFLFLVL